MLMSDALATPASPAPIAEIQQSVAQHFGITLEELNGRCVRRKFSKPRQIAMYIARCSSDRSLPEIARKFGNRDHTTVMHALDVTRRRMQQSEAFCAEVNALLVPFMPPIAVG